MNEPIKYSAGNEPYLGLNSLLALDHLIVTSLNLNSRITAYSHRHSLSRLQKAATRIVPQGFNITLSIRELVRQGQLFSAVLLMRSLIERVGIISYLVNVPSAIDKWEDGWRHCERPSLNNMLKTLGSGKDKESVIKSVDTFDHLVHGDPMEGKFNLVHLDADAFGYGVGRVADNNSLCNFVCYQTIAWLTVLSGMASAAFPGVDESAGKAN
jgi:hypothetical protein